MLLVPLSIVICIRFHGALGYCQECCGVFDEVAAVVVHISQLAATASMSQSTKQSFLPALSFDTLQHDLHQLWSQCARNDDSLPPHQAAIMTTQLLLSVVKWD